MLRAELLIAWFREHRGRLPAEPFLLSPGVEICRPDRFYLSLESDIAAGPTTIIHGVSHVRQRWAGGLLNELAALKRLVESKPQPTSPTAA